MNASKLKLTLLLTATLLPILLATWYYSVSINKGASSTTNKGVLLNPLLDLAELQLVDDQGDAAYLDFEALTSGVDPDEYEPRPWQLLFFNEGECAASCQEKLYFLRQVHIRLGKESERVRRAFVQVGPLTSQGRELQQLLETEQPDMRIIYGERTLLDGILAPGAAGRDPVGENFIYVADPLGNIMLYFTPENSPEELMSDIDRLLDQSSLG